MHVLTVCYGHPADPAKFDDYYMSTHKPLAGTTETSCVPMAAYAPPG